MPLVPVTLRGQHGELDTSPVDVTVISEDRYEVYRPSEATLVLRVSRLQQAFAAGALLFGVTLVAIGLLTLTVSAVGAILVLGGLCTGIPVGLLNSRSTHRFERDTETWTTSWLLVVRSSQPLQHVAAIQLGRGKWMSKNTPGGHRFSRRFLYQFHLVLGDGPFTRSLVCMHHDTQHLRKLGETLSRFLAVPLIISPEVHQEFGIQDGNSSASHPGSGVIRKSSG
jgi:hypothetical protein